MKGREIKRVLKKLHDGRNVPIKKENDSAGKKIEFLEQYP